MRALTVTTALAAHLLPSFANAQSAEAPPSWTTTDAVGGAPSRGSWGVHAWGGWHSFGARGYGAITDRLAIAGGFESVLAIRWRPFVALNVRFVDTARFRLSGEPSFGWLLQRGEFTKLGPSAELRLRMALKFGRVVPFVTLATQLTTLADRTVIDSANGSRTEWSFRHELAFIGDLGLAIAITRAFGLEVGAGYPWYDAPNGVPLPRFFLGIHVGAAR